MLENQKIVSELAVSDPRRLGLQAHYDQRLTDHTWYTAHAPAFRRSIRGPWVVVFLASTWMLYLWVAPPPQGCPAWLQHCWVGLAAVALLVSFHAPLAVWRRAMRERADFTWNVKSGSQASNGDGPRRIHR